MATKERAGGRLFRLPRRDTVKVSRRAVMGLAEAGVGFLLGGVLAGAELFGLYAPFGVAAVAAAGSGLSGFCTLAGSCLGYLCLEGMTDGMRYGASAILTYSVAFAFYDARFYRRTWFMPSIAALLSALTGIICRGGEGWYGEDLVYFVTEVLFTAAAAYSYRVVFTQWPETLRGLPRLSPKQTVGLLMLAGTVLMSLARVEVLETFSLGRLLAAVGVMAVARRGPAGGGLTGACVGVALDLSSGEAPYYSLVFALAGLACGLCRDHRKLLAGLVYVLATLAVVLWRFDGGIHVGLPLEAVVGGVLFAVLPLPTLAPPDEPAEAAEGQGEPDQRRQVIARKMGEMAGAFHTLYDSLRQTLRPEETGGEDPAEIFTATADKVCANCVLRATCWQKEYQDTRTVLNDASIPILSRGRALPTDFAERFSSRCVHFPELLAEINRQLTAYLRRKQALGRTLHTRRALCGQYARLDKLLRAAATELSAGLTPDLPRQTRLNDFLTKEYNLSGDWSIIIRRGGSRWRSPPPRLSGPVRPAGNLSDLLGIALGEEEQEDRAALFPGRAAPGHGGPAGQPPEGGGGERRHRPVVPAGGRDALPAAVRRHGLRGGGPAGERPGSQAAGRISPGGDRPAKRWRPSARPWPPGGGRRQHHHRPAGHRPVYRPLLRPQAGGCPHLFPPGAAGQVCRGVLPPGGHRDRCPGPAGPAQVPGRMATGS